MKRNVIAWLLIMAFVLLSCVGCASEDIVPKEPENDVPTEDQAPKQEPVAYEVGWLALAEEYYAEKTSPFVLYAETYEECQALQDQTVIEIMKDKSDERYELATKYTEEYFESKELIVAVWYQKNTSGMTDYRVNSLVAIEEEGKETAFCLMTELYDVPGETFVGASALRVHVIEVDKSLGITPENLTFEWLDHAMDF